ncbi:clathrin light chain A-like [Watersipora subatra]|uniref:clathrin light chain A-like n=1 Tax=Watersipora subatra TaxID=2589382 RepID=UPI00355C0164
MSDAFETTPPAFTDGDEDPAADFLAREQDELAAIDGDASFDFNAAQADPQGGFSQYDAFDPVSADSPPVGGDAFGDADMGTAAASLYEEPEPVVQNGPYSAISGLDRLAIEPEKIKKWREDQQKMLEEKDSAEAEQIEEMRRAARKELDDWYRHKDEQLEKTKATNRAAEEAYVQEIEDKEPGSEFERICKLCDFNPKNSKNTRDVSRFRSILLQLKQGGLIRNLQ